MFVKRTRGISSSRKNSSPSSPPTVNVAVAHIRVGSYYEIDSSILPQRSPENLKSIRVVLVTKITARDVYLRYPTMSSLQSHFGSSRMNRNKPLKKRSVGGLLPVFDEGHVMVSELAGDLLYRRITPHEISINRFSWSFWVSSASSPRSNTISQPAYNTRLSRPASPEGILKWGRRLPVQYKSRHIDDNNKNKEGEESSKVKDGGVCKAETEEEDEIENEMTAGNRKRKLTPSSSTQRVVVDRWSVDRHELAERTMLEVMKEKNAVLGNSILRSDLRSEARKLIGDTGLLDYVLKHMTGKVAPGGQDRFRRKRNADGALEYWLESSELNRIRKEAGVEDPYWTPPPGWTLGDNPTQDPVCAGEIREIKEELASLKRELEKHTSKKEEEVLILTTPNSCVSSCQNMDHDNLMTPAKEIYADLLKKKYKIEDQLVIIGETLQQMELLQEDMMMGWCLKNTVEKNLTRKIDSPETPIRNTGFRICKPVGIWARPKLPALDDDDATTTTTDTVLSNSNAELASSSSQRPAAYKSPGLFKPIAAKGPLCLPFPFKVTPEEVPLKNLFNV